MNCGNSSESKRKVQNKKGEWGGGGEASGGRDTPTTNVKRLPFPRGENSYHLIELP